MFIIVESGSTKADWVVVENDGNLRQYKTEGVNPATQTSFFLLSDQPSLLQDICAAKNIYFYGAGIVGEMSRKRVTDWLSGSGFHGNLSLLEDMLAAARACCGTDSGIVCILGTGSNSCVYDGTRITHAIPTLGYILSDEGGGVHIGKEIIKSYFYETMPIPEQALFDSTYHLTKEELIEKVYHSPASIRYLASFSEFLLQCSPEWKDEILSKVFDEFIALRIMLYAEHKSLPIYFVGSIAYYHEEALKAALARNGLACAGIIRQPIYQLIEFHKNNR
ncbi:MAG: hypothetical protein LW630_06650 [Saprospiraceae bacterium]|jgi:glucosamine kinase|nr:hypothetical protein [Saprospiraceae bacterium]